MEFDNKTIVSKDGGADGSSFQIRDFLLLCMNKWYWFVIIVGVSLGISMYWVKSTAPIYIAKSSLLIKPPQNSKFGALDEIGIGFFERRSSSILNEIAVMSSATLITDVVRELELTTEYYRDGMFYRRLLYGSEQLVSVEMPDMSDEESGEFTILFKGEEGFVLTSFIGGGVTEEQSLVQVNGHISDTLSTPLGRVIVVPTPYYYPPTTNVYVRRRSLANTVNSTISKLRIDQPELRTTIASLSYTDINRKRAEDVLNCVMKIYSDSWIVDRNQATLNTSYFISERLNLIERELGDVDKKISSYRSENLVQNPTDAVSAYLSQIVSVTEQIRDLENQVNMAKYVRTYLTDAFSNSQLLPANTGISQANVDGLIAEYNAKMIERNSLVANSSERNPTVQDADAQLQSMRVIVLNTVDNVLRVLNSKIMSLREIELESKTKMSDAPIQSQYLLSAERQQSVKEGLYLFLLQKREENEISQAFTSNNTKILAAATSSFTPIAPKPKSTYMMAFIIAMLIPMVIIFIKEIGNSKVRGRADLKFTNIPFLAEIPQYEIKGRKGLKEKLLSKFSKGKKSPVNLIVVKHGSRNSINEAFRVLRTNLEFITRRNEAKKIIMTTSVNPGGGKTFITLNSAKSFAIKQYKVAVVDLDLRIGTLSRSVNSPEIGVANFLNGDISNIDDIIVSGTIADNLDIIPVGTIPPNPTELLREGRLQYLFQYLSDRYDIVFVDTPPVDLVADTSIINEFVDYTMFIIRAELLDKHMLPEIERKYNEKSLNNMNIVLNGTYEAYGKYGYRRYGYKYGYRYGYSSGYHKHGYYYNDKD